MSLIKIANLCMIIDKEQNKVVLINRKKSWKGWAFPGGHLEGDESIIESVLREVKEETGLTISEPSFEGIKHWYSPQTGERYMVFCFKTYKYTGTLRGTEDEGEVAWFGMEALADMNLSEGLKEDLAIFTSEHFEERYAYWNTASS
jgi:8-oxo-dGTP diphosphatase